jgi:hypothetical protein
MDAKWRNILTVVIGFLALSMIFKAPVLSWVALGIGGLSIILPPFATGFNWLWLKIGHVLAWFNSRVILGVVYFFVLVPIAFLARLFGKDKMHLKKAPEGTMFVTRDHTYTSKDLENPF